MIQDLLRYGQVHTAWIGAVTATVTPEEAKRLGLPSQGRARRSRLRRLAGRSSRVEDRRRDHFGRRPLGRFTRGVLDLHGDHGAWSAGRAHGGARQRHDARKCPAGDVPTNLGLRILADVAGLRVTANGTRLVVSEVTSGSRAERIGITAGDVVIGVGGIEVTSVKELNDEVTKAVEHSAFILDIAHGGAIYDLTFPMAV